MTRHDLSEVSLFGSGTTGPRPSFRPAVEALEVRLVLDSGFGGFFDVSQVINAAVGQIGQSSHASTPASGRQTATQISKDAFEAAWWFDMGKIPFAEAAKRTGTAYKQLFKMRNQPEAKNSQFRVALENARIFRDFVLWRGEQPSTSSGAFTLESYITGQLQNMNEARKEALLGQIHSHGL